MVLVLVLVLGVAGVIVALAIAHLPGRGGHIPADGPLLAMGGGLGVRDVTYFRRGPAARPGV